MKINTKLLMTASALLLGIIGVLLSFLPQEIANYLSIESNIITILFLQILSALYLGFGILNWMARGTLIGGIYNRPIALGNLMHFGVGAIALVKVFSSIHTYSEIIISLTIVYTIFALLFAYVFKTTPAKVVKQI
jgi:membrane protease YdiL (CAAX protease family)